MFICTCDTEYTQQREKITPNVTINRQWVAVARSICDVFRLWALQGANTPKHIDQCSILTLSWIFARIKPPKQTQSGSNLSGDLTYLKHTIQMLTVSSLFSSRWFPQAYKASICNKPECQFLLAAWWTVDGCKNRISDKNFCSKNVNLPRSLFINVCRILLPPKYFLSIFITKMKSVRYYLIYNWKIFDKYFILTDRKYFHLKMLKRTIIIF